jgi:aspartyl-tRNA(Asn)/glutamyl-tRNA(Gln) amidotransferase subunit C
MVELNSALTRRVSELARLELTDPEVDEFTLQLADILKYADQLQVLDVTGIEPLYHPLDPHSSDQSSTHLRPDVIKPPQLDESGKPLVLKSGPDVLYDGFKVPPIL